MKNLKFRFWDKKFNSYFYSDDFDFDSDEKKLIAFFKRSDACSYKNYEQFTGIQDYYGKNIYDGDYVNYYIQNSKRVGFVNFCNYYNGWVVKDCECYPKSEFGVYPLTSGFLALSSPVIVGNVNQNPELY